jgi:hypothetical protein
MALAIRLPKSELHKTQALDSPITELCETVTDTEEDRIYVPMSGKLLDLVKLLFQHNIAYVLHATQQR